MGGGVTEPPPFLINRVYGSAIFFTPVRKYRRGAAILKKRVILRKNREKIPITGSAYSKNPLKNPPPWKGRGDFVFRGPKRQRMAATPL